MTKPTAKRCPREGHFEIRIHGKIARVTIGSRHYWSNLKILEAFIMSWKVLFFCVPFVYRPKIIGLRLKISNKGFCIADWESLILPFTMISSASAARIHSLWSRVPYKSRFGSHLFPLTKWFFLLAAFCMHVWGQVLQRTSLSVKQPNN